MAFENSTRSRLRCWPTIPMGWRQSSRIWRELSVADRRKVAQAEFPFVPVDADRAELFAAMNDPGFPTPTIVAMWRANPERLTLAMNVLAIGNAACQVKGKEAKNGERN